MMNFLVFELCSRIIELARNWKKKFVGYVNRNDFDQNAVPIARRNATIPWNKNKTMNAIISHYWLLIHWIHKAQGGTFGEVVYHYKRGHSNKLVYVALSRLTNLKGLYIVPQKITERFCHGLIEPHHKTIVDVIANLSRKEKDYQYFHSIVKIFVRISIIWMIKLRNEQIFWSFLRLGSKRTRVKHAQLQLRC